MFISAAAGGMVMLSSISRCRRMCGPIITPEAPRLSRKRIKTGRLNPRRHLLLIFAVALGTISVARSSPASALTRSLAFAACPLRPDQYLLSDARRGSQRQPRTRPTSCRLPSQRKGYLPVAQRSSLPVEASVASAPYRSRNGTLLEMPGSTGFTVSATALGTSIPIQQSMRPSRQPAAQNRFHVYCDLDGVLVDFERGIRAIFPELPAGVALQDLDRSRMWGRVLQSDAFFQHLSWTQSGPRLWKALQPLRPDILTGVPVLSPSARREKYLWCLRELQGHYHLDATDRPVRLKHLDMAGRFGTHTSSLSSKSSLPSLQRTDDTMHIITCWSSNKHHESRPGAVLIDDQEWLRRDWEAKGGIFIHHSPDNVEATLEQLRRHHILPPEDDDKTIGCNCYPGQSSVTHRWRSLMP